MLTKKKIMDCFGGDVIQWRDVTITIAWVVMTDPLPTLAHVFGSIKGTGELVLMQVPRIMEVTYIGQEPVNRQFMEPTHDELEEIYKKNG